jgi:hypothetical protein
MSPYPHYQQPYHQMPVMMNQNPWPMAGYSPMMQQPPFGHSMMPASSAVEAHFDNSHPAVVQQKGLTNASHHREKPVKSRGVTFLDAISNSITSQLPPQLREGVPRTEHVEPDENLLNRAPIEKSVVIEEDSDEKDRDDTVAQSQSSTDPAGSQPQ